MKKLYYSIGETAAITGLEAHVLRYWETTFPQLKPAKNKAGKRIYTDADIKLIVELKELVRDQKYSTSGARDVLKKAKNAAPVATVRLPADSIKDLRAVRQFLQTMLNEI